MRKRSESQQRHPRTQSGSALLEVTIALMLTGLLLVPLATMFLMSARVNSITHSNISDSAIMRRLTAAWSEDVRSVAYNGVNEPSELVCGDPSAPVETGDYVTLITFNQAATSLVEGRTVTWVAKGRHEDVTLVRRVCVAGQFQREETLLENAGEHGRPLTGVDGVFPMASCDYNNPERVSRKCTLQVRGVYTFDIVARRRVPDARMRDQVPFRPDPPHTLHFDPFFERISLGWTQEAAFPPVELYEAIVYNADGSEHQRYVFTAAGVGAAGPITDQVIDQLAVEPVTYTVRIRAQNAVGWSDFSTEMPIWSEPTAPLQPTVVSVSVDEKQATVTWQPNPARTGLGINGYQVKATKISTNETFVYSGTRTGISWDPPPATLSATVTGLTDFEGYRFEVTDTNSKGNSPVSDQSGDMRIIPWNDSALAKRGGSDTATCGTKAAPCASVGKALANSTGKKYVLVATNTTGDLYPRFDIGGSPAGSVIGGFDSVNFDHYNGVLGQGDLVAHVGVGTAPSGSGASRTGVSALPSLTKSVDLTNLVIEGGTAQDSTYAGIEVRRDTRNANIVVAFNNVVIKDGGGKDPTGLLVNKADVAVTGSTINSGSVYVSGGANSGHSAYGVRALAGANVQLDNVSIAASAGIAGASGTAQNENTTGGCGGVNASGNGGATAAACPTAVKGGNGGKGGSSKGENGTGGSPGSKGATGGGGGAGNNCNGCNGGDGPSGNYNGQAGAQGAANAATVAPNLANQGSIWVGVNGVAGNAGGDGGGGGGGGGGGAGCTVGFFACGTVQKGGGGGSGGGGGAGGYGGNPGFYGGGSFGVYASGTGTVVTVTNSHITTGPGGAGGAGGKGGKGGNGGSGGSGANGDSGLVFHGGKGATGGAGGGAAGGNGGNGGSGGPSIALFATNGATRSATGLTTTVGDAGAVGPAGAAGAKGTSSGNSGPDGRTGAAGYAGTQAVAYPAL